MRNGHLAACLAYTSGAGFAIALTMGQWEETALWTLVIIVSAWQIHKEIK